MQNASEETRVDERRTGLADGRDHDGAVGVGGGEAVAGLSESHDQDEGGARFEPKQQTSAPVRSPRLMQRGDEWTRCKGQTTAACIGVTTPPSEFCLAHIKEEEGEDKFIAVLARLRQETALDLRGVVLNEQLLASLLEAFTDKGRTILPTVHAYYATLQGNARFQRVHFRGEANFDEATFEGAARFDEARFGGLASFAGVRFKGDAQFAGATFSGEATFDGAIFSCNALFGDISEARTSALRRIPSWGLSRTTPATVGSKGGKFTRISGTELDRTAEPTKAILQHATFEGVAGFIETTFTGEARFTGVAFEQNVSFRHALFESAVDLDETTFGTTVSHSVVFDGARFEKARQLGPFSGRGRVSFEATTFKERVQVQVGTRILSCRHALFAGGVHLRARWAQIQLDYADFACPSIVAGTQESMEAGLAEEGRRVL